ncbi:MAG: hypothetical protein KZQ63_06365 [Candidatus Thiodiazotropha sp. (ex Lucinoma aequizonata)]|nr:hypothetical protein [Candidatus Thiodiazotropha sp. (ex Lucinoma aequizonata)]
MYTKFLEHVTTWILLIGAIPAIQPRLRLSGTNRLRSAFHGGQRSMHRIAA